MCDGLASRNWDCSRGGEQVEDLRFLSRGTATIASHERERSRVLSGPPGSRSRHLGIKRPPKASFSIFQVYGVL